jgi:hypothetical protein
MLQLSNLSNYMPKDENGDKGTRPETDIARAFDQERLFRFGVIEH